MSFFKHSPPPGSRPGTLAIPPDSPVPRIHVYVYDEGGCREQDLGDVEDLVAFADLRETVWVDIQGLGDENVLRRVAEIFELHPLVLEDAVNVPQRAKSELYPDQQVVVARVPEVDAEGDVRAPQVCMVLAGGDVLVTFQERYFGYFDPVRQRIRAGQGPIWRLGAAYLVYALIDTLVSRYLPVVERISSELDEIEDDVIERATPEVLARIHRLRRQLVIIRRVGWPQRDTIQSLVRDPSPHMGDEVRVFLRGTDTHMAQIIELAESAREMATGLSEIYLATVSQRTNEVMKVLTLMASIFIPLTFVAGVYGMNFEHMPELHARTAYPTVLIVMAVIAVAMLVYFRFRGWLGGGRTR